MLSKKWYLKRNISCDANLLNELLETDVEDDCFEMMPSWCRQVNWGNCGIPWVNCAILCERRLERTVLRPALLPVKTAQFTQFFPSGMTSHSKITQFNWQCIAPFNGETRWGWGVNVTPRSLYPLIPWHSIRGWVGPRAGLDILETREYIFRLSWNERCNVNYGASRTGHGSCVCSTRLFG